MWWLKSKQQIHKDETLITTGYYKLFATDCIFIILQPYWFLMDISYKDSFNEHSKDLLFQLNDALTVLQIFVKMNPVYVYIIELTNWTNPKA